MNSQTQATFPVEETMSDQFSAIETYSAVDGLPPLVVDSGGDDDQSDYLRTPTTDSSAEGFPFASPESGKPCVSSYEDAPSAISSHTRSLEIQVAEVGVIHQRGMIQTAPKMDIPGNFRKMHQHEHNKTASVHVTVYNQTNLPAPSSKFQYSQPSIFSHGRRKALCIGINYAKNTRGHLEGCVSDAHRMRDFLVEYGGYKFKDIVTLTDDGKDRAPTRQNILNAMQDLVHDARPGDYFFLHYAGHGIQVADVSGDETDGQDEAIVPIDYSEDKPGGCILDDLLSEILVKPLPKRSRLTAVIDACHSGTALDLPFNYLCEGKRDTLTLCTKKYSPSNGSVVSWSGCADVQESEEIRIKSGTISGLMTDAFIDSLKNNKSQTYQQLYDDIWERIALSHRQKPQLGVSHEIEADHPFVF